MSAGAFVGVRKIDWRRGGFAIRLSPIRSDFSSR
jgi:hypothetical protein